jgi:hypothetical protein
MELDYEFIPATDGKEPDVKIRYTPEEVLYMAASNCLISRVLEDPEYLRKLIKNPHAAQAVTDILKCRLNGTKDQFESKMITILDRIVRGQADC